MEKLFVVVILAFLCGAVASNYVKTGSCKDKKICSYKYGVSARIKGGEKVDITAEVDIVCESKGTYEKEPAIRYCIAVENAVARTANEKKKYETKNIVPVKEMNKWFCFAQSTSSGKIIKVFHPKDEKEWIVNFKKSIASAFQANYKNTEVADETDSQSRHKSHYKYYSEGEKQIQERRINTRDVSRFPQEVFVADSDSALYFHEHDKLELDNEKRVQFSEGKSVLEHGPEEEEKGGSENDGDKGIPALGAISDYKLKLVRCYRNTKKGHVAKLSAVLDSPMCTVDDVLATINEAKMDEETMRELNDELPSFDESVSRIQRDAESQESMELISKWRMLVELESKNGPLAGTTAKLPQLLQRLHVIKLDDSSSDERVLIYHLLSSSGSLESQQALLDMLKIPQNFSELTSLLVEIALLPSVHTSTIDSLIQQYESLKPDDHVSEQLILSIATLGRHKNLEKKIVDYLSVKLKSALTLEETSLFIHALGNTASKGMIPLLLDFLSDPNYQAYTIDALRTVSIDERVEKEFAKVVSHSLYSGVVYEVVESLLFPFKHSIYSSTIKKDLIVCDELKTSLVEAGIRYNENELTKSLKQYFTNIKDKASSRELEQRLEEKVPAHRIRRASTKKWSSNEDSKYNLIAGLSQRNQDVKSYPYHKGYLWAKKIGSSKIYAAVAAGGFGGIGIPGIKLFARARVDLVAWSKSYTALDVIFSYLRVFPDKNSKSTLTYRRYIKIVGYTLLNQHYRTTSSYRYSHTWQKKVKLFTFSKSFWIYIGTLQLTISSHITGTMTFAAYIARMDNDKNMKAAAELKTGPTLTVKGEAVATILFVFQIGLDVTASISYHITPEASTSVCDKYPKGDANACFEVHSTTTGKVSLSAFWKRGWSECRWRGWSLSCKWKWSRKYNFAPLSKTWTLYSKKTKLFGLCQVCDCKGNYFLNVLCKGDRSGPSTCSCRTHLSYGK